jgi:putative flippase GtrA
MPEALLRVWRLYHTPTGRKLYRYTMVSVISTAVSASVLAIVYGGLRVWSEVPSTVFANVVATVPSYYLNRSWVWGKGGRSHLMREVLPFWFASLVGITLSILAASEAKHISDVHNLHHFGRTVIVVGANFGAFATLWVLKFLVFNRLFHVHPVADLEHQAEVEAGVEDGSSAPPDAGKRAEAGVVPEP